MLQFEIINHVLSRIVLTHLLPSLLTIQNKNTQFTFIPYMNVSIGGGGANYIIQTSTAKSATVSTTLMVKIAHSFLLSQATIKVLQNVVVNNPAPSARPSWVGWLIAGLSILLVLIIVTLIVVVSKLHV